MCVFQLFLQLASTWPSTSQGVGTTVDWNDIVAVQSALITAGQLRCEWPPGDIEDTLMVVLLWPADVCQRWSWTTNSLNKSCDLKMFFHELTKKTSVCLYQWCVCLFSYIAEKWDLITSGRIPLWRNESCPLSFISLKMNGNNRSEQPHTVTTVGNGRRVTSLKALTYNFVRNRCGAAEVCEPSTEISSDCKSY